MIGCRIDAGENNISAYAMRPDDHTVVVTIINKESKSDANISVDPGALISFRAASLCRLLGPSLESTTGVTLGGAIVSADGGWKPARLEQLKISGHKWQLQLPAASAAMVTLHR
jgi:hypothetical protein